MMDEENLSQEPETFEMTDSDGNTILVRELENFFYNGEEFVILADTVREDRPAPVGDEDEQIDCYIMRVVTSEQDGEEMEEFLPIEDESLERRLMEVATTRLNEEDEEE